MKHSNLLFYFTFLLTFFGISGVSVHAQDSRGFVDFKEIDKDQINKLHLSISSPNWKYLLDSLRYNGDDYLPIESATLNGKKYSTSSLSYVQQAVFKADQNQRSIWLQIDGDKELQLVKVDKDPSLVREILATEIYNHFMIVPQVAYAKVFVNDDFYGFMLLREQVNESFISEHFNNRHNTGAIKTKPSFSIESTNNCISGNYGSLLHELNKGCLESLYSGQDYLKVNKLTAALKDADMNLDQILDVNSAIWMLALNDVTMNFDSYNGFKSTNYYLVEDQFGRLNFVPFNLELAFGGKKRVTEQSDYSLDMMAKLPLAFHKDNSKYPLIRRILADDTNYRTYISHCRAILDVFYSSGKYLSLANKYQSLVLEGIMEDPVLQNKKDRIESNLYKTVGKRSQIPGIEEIVEAREDFLKKETVLKILGPEVFEYGFVKRERFSNVKIEDFVLSVQADRYTESIKVHYRFSDKQAFVSTVLLDDGEHNDQVRNDKIFGVKISPPDGYEELEFYFELDNSKMKSYFPGNFERKTYKANLKTLNE